MDRAERLTGFVCLCYSYRIHYNILSNTDAFSLNNSYNYLCLMNTSHAKAKSRKGSYRYWCPFVMCTWSLISDNINKMLYLVFLLFWHSPQNPLPPPAKIQAENKRECYIITTDTVVHYQHKNSWILSYLRVAVLNCRCGKFLYSVVIGFLYSVQKKTYVEIVFLIKACCSD